ncbi:MAG: hypothetical protein WC451_02710 [Patescibacteria group bacterium]
MTHTQDKEDIEGKEEKEQKSWYFSLVRSPREPALAIASAELPGGKDDAGLMKSDLLLLFQTLLEHAHPDLTQKEIKSCFAKACFMYATGNKYTPTPSGQASGFVKLENLKEEVD